MHLQMLSAAHHQKEFPSALSSVKQGLSLSLTLIGLYVDGLHLYIGFNSPADVPVLSTGTSILDTDCVDDTAFMSKIAVALQRLLNLISACCALMGMVISIPKTKVLVLNIAFLGPNQWTCDGQQHSSTLAC